jgi:hypothetical protein
MGLLGNGWDDPQSEAVMALAGGLLQGSFGRGATGYAQALSGAKDRDMKRKYLDMQMQGLQSDVDLRKQKAQKDAAELAEGQRIRQLLANAGRVAPGMGAGLSPADSSALPPEFQIGASIPALQQPGQIDYQNLFRQGVPIDMLKGLSESANLGKPKVKNIETVNINGKPMKVGIDEYGQQVAQIGMEWRPLKTQDMGGYIGTFDETNPGAGVTKLGDKTMTFADKIAQGNLGVSQANLGLARQRLSFDQSQGGAKAPTGYRFKADGTLEAIPGGPADIKAGELGAKAEARQQAQAAQAKSVLGVIGDAKTLVGPTTAGFGALAANIPATDARNLQAKLETIKANLGFDRLQQMREESPTGGALGQVAVQELIALQSTVASLDQKQSPTQLAASLDKAEKHYKRWLEVVESAGKQNTGGATGSWGKQESGVVDWGSLK